MSSFRDLFPIFKQHPSLVYLDNAATTQVPQKIIERLTKFYTNEKANIHRGLYHLSTEASQNYENSRQQVADFIKADSAQEIIFTKGTTEAINLVATSWGLDNLKVEDQIIISQQEHHSNFLPWQKVAHQTKSELIIWPINQQTGQLELEQLLPLINPKTKLLAVTQASNVLGLINDIETISQQAKAKNPNLKILVDSAQTAAQLPIDRQKWSVDWIVFSAHKMYGPFGMGVLWGKKEVLTKMRPYQYGGGMVGKVSLSNSTWQETPTKFEAGTPSIASAICWPLIIETCQAAQAQLEYQELITYTAQKLQNLKEIKLLIKPQLNNQLGIFCFTIPNTHPHDISELLNESGVSVRAGHHCAQPLLMAWKIGAVVRISLAPYNTKVEIDHLVETLIKIPKILQNN